MNVTALRSYFNEQSGTPQRLGAVDCVKFVAGAVRVGWGRDFSTVLQYHNRRSAVDRLRELGGLKGACDVAMGDMHPVDELEPGDVVWFEKPDTIGVLMPGYIALKMGKTIHRLKVLPGMMGWKTNGR